MCSSARVLFYVVWGGQRSLADFVHEVGKRRPDAVVRGCLPQRPPQLIERRDSIAKDLKQEIETPSPKKKYENVQLRDLGMAFYDALMRHQWCDKAYAHGCRNSLRAGPEDHPSRRGNGDGGNNAPAFRKASLLLAGDTLFCVSLRDGSGVTASVAAWTIFDDGGHGYD